MIARVDMMEGPIWEELRKSSERRAEKAHKQLVWGTVLGCLLFLGTGVLSVYVMREDEAKAEMDQAAYSVIADHASEHGAYRSCDVCMFHFAITPARREE